MNEAQTLFTIFFAIIYGFRLASLRSGTFPIAMVFSRKERNKRRTWIYKRGIRFFNIAKKRAALSIILLYFCPILYFTCVLFLLSDFQISLTSGLLSLDYLKVILLLLLPLATHGFAAIHTAFLIWKSQSFIHPVKSEKTEFLKDKPDTPKLYFIGSLPYFLPFLIFITWHYFPSYFPTSAILIILLFISILVICTIFESKTPVREASLKN